MKSILKFLGIGLLCFIGLVAVMTAWITSQAPSNTTQNISTPKPTLSDEQLSDLGKRYYSSHIKMKWDDDHFYGGKLTEESAKKVMKQCFEAFEDEDRCESVINEQFWIGMSDKWAMTSMGVPNDINETTTANSTREQWVYGNPIYGATYLYFENHILTSYQK